MVETTADNQSSHRRSAISDALTKIRARLSALSGLQARLLTLVIGQTPVTAIKLGTRFQFLTPNQRFTTLAGKQPGDLEDELHQTVAEGHPDPDAADRAENDIPRRGARCGIGCR